MFPGQVVNCQSEFPKLSESYNNHLLKLVKLTKVTCSELAKGYKRTLFHLPKVKKVTGKFLDFYVDVDLISLLIKPS